MEPTMRRRSIFKFKKYIFMFFALLITIIWVNHYTQSKSSEKVRIEDLPVAKQSSHVEVKPTPPTESLRERRLRILYERLLSFDEETTEETTTEDPIPQDPYEELLSEIQKRMRKRKPPTRFFVMNPKCKMPHVDPFSSELQVKAIPNPVITTNCSNEGPIFALKFDKNLLRYRLEVDKTLLSKLEPNQRKYYCNYRDVADVKFKTWKSFQDEAIIEWASSGIVAECHGDLPTARTIQEDAFPLVQVPSRTVGVQSDPLMKSPSVLMLGLSSISRMNFERSMPKTAKFVKQEGWFEMKGYNKVEDGAFPNLCAILAGAKSDVVCQQRFTRLWTSFKKAGYTTAFGEDSQEFPVPPGFSPDYHLHTLLEDISQSMRSVTKFGLKHCIGRRQSVSYLLDFCMQFAQRIIEELDQPAFGVFWSSTVTSDYVHGPTSLDDKLVQYLGLMTEHRVFERAIVILLSDQGQMSGDLVDQPDGYLEERLPMLHIYLPPWFRDAYPGFASNLLNNTNRLTAPMDLFTTLRHLFVRRASAPKDLPVQPKCRNSRSLLHPVPFNRSCEDACIGTHWCTCNEFELLDNNISSYHLAKIFVSHINFWMLRNKFNVNCDRLRLVSLDYIERSLVESPDKRIGTFRLRVRTFPMGVFESTVRFDHIVGDIININFNEVSSLHNTNASHCVKGRIAKKFCICYPNKKDDEMQFWANHKLSSKV